MNQEKTTKAKLIFNPDWDYQGIQVPQQQAKLYQVIADDVAVAQGAKKLAAVNELLAQGANPNGKITNNRTPIWIAAKKGEVEILKCFAEYDADFTEQDEEKRNYLFAAVMGCSYPAFNFLLNVVPKNGKKIDINAEDIEHNNVLTFAVDTYMQLAISYRGWNIITDPSKAEKLNALMPRIVELEHIIKLLIQKECEHAKALKLLDKPEYKGNSMTKNAIAWLDEMFEPLKKLNAVSQTPSKLSVGCLLPFSIHSKNKNVSLEYDFLGEDDSLTIEEFEFQLGEDKQPEHTGTTTQLNSAKLRA